MIAGRLFGRCLMLLAVVTTLAAPSALAQTADLLVTKSGPAQSAADTDVAYAVAVTNLGPDAATTITLTDLIPAGMTFTSRLQDSGPAFICSDPGAGFGGTVTCTAATLPAGQAASFTFVFHINAQALPGTTFTNFATVTSDADPNGENNVAVVGTSTPPQPSADLAVSKTGPGAAGADTDVVYTISLANAGPDTAQNVSLNDLLPGTMTFVSLVQNGGPALTCTTPAIGAGGTVNCTAASFPAGQTATLTLTTHVPPATASGTTFLNTASVTSTNDPTAENDNAATQLTVSATDVQVTKIGPATVTAGSNITYTITATNAGPDVATGVSLTDPLPAGTTLVSFTQNSGPVGSCSVPVAGSTGTVVCTFATLAAASPAQFTLIVTTGNVASASNTASIVSESFDTNNGNNTSTVVTTVNPLADLQISKSGPATVTAGQTAAYSISVTNVGPSIASTVMIADTLPAGTTFASLLQQTGPVFSCTTPPAGTAGAISCTLATFAAGTTATFTLTLNVTPSATGSVANTATISSATLDPVPASNSSTTAAAPVIQSADLSVTKSGPASTNAGSTITYTVSVLNGGPSDATTVTLSDPLPANTTFVSATQNSGPAFGCVTPAAGATGTITCTIATLSPATPATFTFVLNVAPAASGTISNTATLTSATTDPALGNNSSTTAATVTTQVDLSILKTGPGAATTGSNLTYTLTVTNGGPADAANVVLNDPLPVETTFVSLTQTGGPAFLCTTPAAGAAGTVNCTIASLPAGTSTFNLVVTVVPVASGPVMNTATVSTASTDPNPANNTSTATTTLSPGATDVSIVKTANGTTFPAGSSVTYTILVTNNGPAVAVATTVTDVLPAGMTATSTSSTQGTCAGTTTVVCSIGNLLPGTSATITLVATLPATTGPVANTATVTIANTNTNAGGGSASAGVAVAGSANVPALSPFALAMLTLLMAAVAVKVVRT